MAGIACYFCGYGVLILLAAEMYYGGEEALSATLSAGRTTTGFIYFTVPVKAEKVEVEYTPNMFLNKKIKFVYEGTKDSGYKPVINNLSLKIWENQMNLLAVMTLIVMQMEAAVQRVHIFEKML